jgi:hypothetical protein
VGAGGSLHNFGRERPAGALCGRIALSLRSWWISQATGFRKPPERPTPHTHVTCRGAAPVNFRESEDSDAVRAPAR